MTKTSDTLTLRGKTAKNRIVFLPCVTFSFHGDGGDYFGRQHIEHYTQMAEGGAGIVYVQGTNALGVLDEEGMWTCGSKKTLEKITSVIHKNGALAMIQLSWGGDRETDLNTLPEDVLLHKQKELLEAGLTTAELGFDGFEFHFGHGFLLCRFFDREANLRTDRFGGNLENRINIITDIIPELRAKNGDDFILALRMGAYLPDLETGLETARYLERSGIDLLNITSGMVLPPKAPADFPLSDTVHGGYMIHRAVNIPVIGVGGLTTKEKTDTLIENDYADLAGIARGILADPEFPNKILAGKPVSECAACKQCLWFTDHTKCPARLRG